MHIKTSFFIPTLVLLASTMATSEQAPDLHLKINTARLQNNLDELAKIGKNPQGGVTRVAYSDQDLEGRKFVMSLMRKAELNPKIDAAGNLVGYLSGKDNTLPPIVMGSHIDTVPEGGNFDGIVGSLGSIEVAQTLVENKVRLTHPLEIFIFQNEEGGHLGSRAITNGLSEDDLKLKSLSGKSIQEGIKFIGGSSLSEKDNKPIHDKIFAFLELHIEQGGVLEHSKKQIGVVEGIVGIRRWNITFKGLANHAGTTPMKLRKDALLAAGQFIVAANQAAVSVPGKQVATVGKIDATPGAPNVIASLVKLTIETRDLSKEKIDLLTRKFISEGERIAKSTQTQFSFEKTYDTPPVLVDQKIRNIVKSSADFLKFSSMALPSGAGHDAQEMAKLGPIGMIFIPSVDGISHSPNEFTPMRNIENGTNVFLEALLRTDQSIVR